MKTRTLSVLLAGLVLLAPSVEAPATQAPPENPPVPVYVSGGPVGNVVLSADGTSPFTEIFGQNGGFRPEEIAFGGDGSLYACDPSSSEIHRLSESAGVWSKETIYDRSSAQAPLDPEQPKGCAVVGADLLFLSRNGSGKNQKTGLWAITNVFDAVPGVQPTLLRELDGVGGDSGEGLALAPDGRVFFTFGTEVWVAVPERDPSDNNVLRILPTSDFTLWANTAGSGFGIAARTVLVGTNSFETQVFVAAKFNETVEVFREVSGSGQACGLISGFGALTGSLEFDAAGDLWVTSSRHASGRNGNLHEVVDPSCDTMPDAPDSTVSGLAAAVGVALGPSASPEITDNDLADKSNLNLCNSLFALQAQGISSVCQADISCRLVRQDEFAARTAFVPGQPDFSGTFCADFPSAGGNCVEIRASASCLAELFTANWQFFALNDFEAPGLLYSAGPLDTNGDGIPDAPFSENILEGFDPQPTPDPTDPGMTGSRSDWGSGVVAIDNAPNRAPVVSASTSAATVIVGESFDLIAGDSTDHDWHKQGGLLQPDTIEFTWESNLEGVLATGVEAGTVSPPAPAAIADVATSLNQCGVHTLTLTVNDFPTFGGPGLSASDSVQVTVESDTPPTLDGLSVSSSDYHIVAITDTADGDAVVDLWPPNHEMVPLDIAVDFIAGGCPGDCSIISAESTDPIEGTGDGDAAPDWELVDNTVADGDGLLLNVRSERTSSGAGRTYTFEVQCTNSAGGSSIKTITVRIEASQGD